MNILWFNFDIKHPEAGAEIYTHEIAKMMIENGFNVTLIAIEFMLYLPFLSFKEMIKHVY